MWGIYFDVAAGNCRPVEVEVEALSRTRSSHEIPFILTTPAWIHSPNVSAKKVLIAVSNGQGLSCTWPSRSPPWSVASSVVARWSGSMSGRELPVGMKGSEAIANGGCPLIEPCRDERSGLGVTLGELTNERAKLAAPFCLGALRCGDHHFPPGFDSVRAAERLPLAIDDGLGLVVDDRLHEFVLIGKVVVHLRAADFRRHLDVFQGGGRHPALMDQSRGLLHYSCPGACSLRR